MMLLLSITAGIGPVKTAQAAAAFDLEETIEAASSYFENSANGVGSDWSAIGLMKAGKQIPDTYVQSLINRVKYSNGEFDRVTEIERTVMALTAAGQDATDIAGIDLIEKLYNSEIMTSQGINGPIFALIALDTLRYEVQSDASWTREAIIDVIAARQNADGGFSLSVGNNSDPDITAMALIALAPYGDNPTVKSMDLLADLTHWLSVNQSPEGGYVVTYGKGMPWESSVDSSESVSQAIIGLTASGIDPTGPDYTKNGITLIDKLMQFRLPDGTFSHTADMLISNGMATEQALQALDAYKLLLEGKGERLYDFTGTLPGLKPIPAAPVKIRVEGPEPNQTFSEGTVNAATPLEALKSLSTVSGLELEISSKWGMLALEIERIAYDHYNGDYGNWDFAIHRGNDWLTSSDGAIDQIPLKPSDKLVIYYNNYDTVPIDSIEVLPESGTSLNEEHAFDIRVYKLKMDYSTFKLVPVLAEGVYVDIVRDGETISTQTTNAEGTARFEGVSAGSYTVSVSKYITGSAPAVVHTTMPLEVRSGIPPIDLPLPSGDQPTVTIPSDDRPYIIGIADADSHKQIAITIPETNQSLVMLNLPPTTDLPAIEAKKGSLTFSLSQGTRIISGDGSSIELLTSKNKSDSALVSRVKTLIPSGSALDQVSEAITVGGGTGRVEFNSFLKLTFAGFKGNQAAYIEHGSPHMIQRFGSDAEGLASGKDEYAYDSGDDLIVKTKHFTDYIAFTTKAVTIPSIPTPRATLSVDKLTINKGYVLQNTSFELQPGDTAWSVLKRSLDAKGISYKTEYYASFGSVYVQAIAGDGEFDHGRYSGWMYNVNGQYPGYGSSSYTLKDGDKVEWRYTTNLGKDLGASNSQWPDLSEDTTTIEVSANNQQDQSISITQAMKDKGKVAIHIPDISSKVFLDLNEVRSSSPSILAERGGISFTMDNGTAIQSGNAKFELLSKYAADDSGMIKLVKDSLASGNKKLSALSHGIGMGGDKESYVFDRPVTIMVKGGKDQTAGFIENNTFTPITSYDSEEQGAKATKDDKKLTYAFVAGNDLVIKTNHFTSFVTYSVADSASNVDLNKQYADAKQIATWATGSIEAATSKGFVQGVSGKLNPKTKITRAEFAKLMVEVLGVKLSSGTTSSFTDVPRNKWFTAYINTAYDAGIIAGYDNRFHPNETITREQMAAMVARALKLKPSSSPVPFLDRDLVSKWAQADVQTVIALQIMQGSDNRFNPVDSVTREMAIVVAMRAYTYMQDHN
ncbi:S-layer homology domain-containing protein [Paenibacillus sp. BC26]|uniref:S-layer homology domain-containing protein n=1 Tax=Paenibacillus sp. BC26 TaxID=1881032 RepID=UPI0015A6C931|nr:S-layer homology domain-containing protein [Paenibacillus sp. BC26]